MRNWSKAFVVGLVVLSLWGVGALSADGAEVQKHSGTVVASDRDTLRLAEIGRWQLKGGETVITYRTITVTPSTKFAFVRRGDEATTGFPGDWVEEPAEAWDLLEGDFVTVDCLHEGRRLIALKITVVEMEEP